MPLGAAYGPHPGLAGFNSEHIANAADEHYDAFPEHTERELVRSLRTDLERRYAEDPHNHVGYARASAILQEAIAAGILDPHFYDQDSN